MSQSENATLGLIGVTSTWGTASFAFFSSATTIVAFFSALVGLAIGLLTLYRMVRNPPKP